MPAIKIDDLSPGPPAELTSEQMDHLLGGTALMPVDVPTDDFCGTPPPPFMPRPDRGSLPEFDPPKFRWKGEVPSIPSGPAGPCGLSELPLP